MRDGTVVEQRLFAKIQRLAELGGPSDLEALELALSERIRQMEQEGWSPAFDDVERRSGALASSAGCYALATAQKALVHSRTGSQDVRPSAPHASWPFQMVDWKPASMNRTACKAAALLLAEMARHLRAGIS